MSGPLDGVCVVDLSRIVAGPLATQILGDYGAEVVKIELPGVGDDSRSFAPPYAPDGSAAYFFCVNRNKKSVTLNLKHPAGAEAFLGLVRRADVLVENFTPGTMDDLGLGWSRLSAENPRLVYCAISGFGPSGPERHRAGYDTVLQAQTGLMSITGEPDGPPVKAGVALIDEITALYAHGAILAALRHRDRTGRGQRIDCSLLECGVAAMMNAASNYLIAGTVMRRWGSAQETVVPYQAFRARDGYLIIGAGNQRLWGKLCEALDSPEWRDDPRFATNADRVAHRAELVALIEGQLAAHGRDEWLRRLALAGLAVGPINTVDEVFQDAQVLHRGMVQEVEHPTAGRVRLVGIPVKFSESAGEIRLPPPLLGQHTAEVLRERCGLDEARVEALRREGAL